MNSDCNTVEGAVFDHKGETPGLGAEISLPAFQDQFIGKKIFKDDKFMSITLTKGVGSSEGNPHAVDAISGGTLTSNGVRDMLRVCLSDYTPFFEKTRKADQDKTLTQDGASSPDGTSQQSTVEHETKTE